MIAIKMNFNDPLEVSSNGYIDRAQITAIPGMLVYQDGEVIVDYSHSVQMPKMQSDNLDDVNLEKSIDANMTKAQILLTLIVIFCCLASTSLKYMWILIHFCQVIAYMNKYVQSTQTNLESMFEYLENSVTLSFLNYEEWLDGIDQIQREKLNF